MLKRTSAPDFFHREGSWRETKEKKVILKLFRNENGIWQEEAKI